MVNTAKKLTPKYLYIIITSLMLALLITAYIVINALFNSGAIGGTGSSASSGSTVTYDESIGESQYLGTPTVYSYVKKANITKISVKSHVDDFVMQRPQEKDSGKYLSYFVFRYKDADSGKYVDYTPNIAFTGEKFTYDDLYAIETSDGLNATKIEYLCAMIGALYFQNKVELKAETRDEQLRMYGLDEENREVVVLDYLDADGKEQRHTVYIGDKLITGTGYYFMLEGREIIYASAQSDRLSSVLGGFEKLVNSRIVAATYGSDGTFEPYLTTGYKQWINKYSNTEGSLPTADSLVIFNASTKSPDYVGSDKADDDGYILSGYTDENMLNLKEVKTNYQYYYITKALRTMGVSESVGEAVSATVLTNFLEAELYDADKGTGTYTYTINAIEAVYTQDKSEITTLGTPVLDAKRVKVAYDVSLDGKKLNAKPYHAVIDLDGARAIPDAAKAEILASSVGELSTPIVYTTRYEEGKANTRTVSFKIVSINQIYKLVGEGDEQTVEYQEKIDGKSIVYMSVCYVLKDEYGKTEATTTDSFVIDLAKVTGGDDLIVKNAILGMGAGETDKLVELGRKYYQDMQAFEVYEIENVVGFMDQELVVAFKYTNDRDDFYGESTYQNILSELESNHKYKDYAMNVENCDRVVRILGGISDDGTSAGAVGLVGAETVAVGLTSEVMRKYHLYEGKTVSFGLPRGIDESPVDEDDFIWDHALTFTLYISPVQYGERGEKFYYIASDMYDIVVKFTSDELDYLDYSFAEFWARRNMVMISSANIDMIELDFKMSDLYGSYVFDVEHNTIYIGADGQHYNTLPADGGDEYDFISVYASIKNYESDKTAVAGKYTETELSKYLVSLEKKRLDLAELYNRAAGIKPGGYGLTMGHDTAGTGYYKEMLMVMFSTYYMGVLTEDDITAGEAKESMMKLAFTVKSSTVLYKYCYEFIRLDDRRVMVSFYREDDEGNKTQRVSDFYITDFAFKKIVYAYTSLLSGKAFDADTAYGD